MNEEQTPVARTSSIKSLVGLLGSMFVGAIAGCVFCLLLGPQGIANIVIVCTFALSGATTWWSRGKGIRFGCWIVTVVLFLGYMLPGLLRSTTGF